MQRHPGPRCSRAVLRGQQGRCKSPGQVAPLPGTALAVCLCPFTSHSLLSNTSGQVEEGRDSRLQWRDPRSDSHESRSPDSACYVSCDSRGSSPDCNLDGELHTPSSKVTIQQILVQLLFQYLHNYSNKKTRKLQPEKNLKTDRNCRKI